MIYHHYDCPQNLDQNGNCNYCINCPDQNPHEAHCVHLPYPNQPDYFPCPGIRETTRKHHPDCTDNTGTCLCAHCGKKEPHEPHHRPGPGHGWINNPAGSGCPGTPNQPIYELTWWLDGQHREHHMLTAETVAFFHYLNELNRVDAQLTECQPDCSYLAITQARGTP